MSTGTRAGTHVTGVEDEGANFNDHSTGVTSPLRIATWDFDPGGIKHQAVENQAVRTKLAEHPPAKGLAHPESEVTFSTYADGLGTATADEEAASAAASTSAQALTELLSASLGGDPSHSTGALVATTGFTDGGGSGAADDIQEDANGAHAEKEFVGITLDDGTVEVRPIDTYVTDTMTLYMNPSVDSISDTNLLLGMTTIKNAEDALHTIKAEFAGKNTAQNYSTYGMVGNFTMPETSEGEPQPIEFTFKVASFNRYESPTQTEPSVLRPLVNAGGEFLIAQHGYADATELPLMRVSIETAAEYAADADGNDEDGLCGWVKVDQQLRITVHVRDTEAMPGGFTVSNYFSSFGSSDLDENKYQLLFNFGQKVGGRLFSVYCPRCHLAMEPEAVEVEGIQAQKLTFAPTIDSTVDNLLWVGLG